MKQKYQDTRLKPESLRQIAVMNGVIEEYQEMGYTLTVRQLYYQLVAKDLIANNEKSYKRTSELITAGRMMGLIDWDAIEDRTRAFIRRGGWDSGREIIENSARGFHMDLWENQPRRVFVMVEKEALVGVLQRVCWRHDVPLLAARGYPSASVVREFANDHVCAAAQQIRIIHLGDHDPSGIDMTRDLKDRIYRLSGWSEFDIDRIALNIEQIKQFNPPPNPAKMTDSRFEEYRKRFGDKCWELDALSPPVLVEMVEERIDALIDPDLLAARKAEIEVQRKVLHQLPKQFDRLLKKQLKGKK